VELVAKNTFTGATLRPIRQLPLPIMPSSPRPELPLPRVAAKLAEPLKRFHDEAWHTPRGRLVREVIFGVNDGVISTLGFLAGLTTSIGEPRLIVLAGLASAFGGAVAMGIGAFVAAKSQRAFFEAEIAREAWEIEHMPEHEREEIREIYGELGFAPDEIEMIVNRVTSNPELWLRFMSREELGLAEETFDSPTLVGSVTSVAYLMGALLLLVPYLLRPPPQPTFPSVVVIAIGSLLATGAAKTWVTKESPFKASLELAGLGILACLVGLVLGRLVGIAI
jgi:VIT1/CCC1 family predicted Fe2+/Mn2+ transporter